MQVTEPQQLAVGAEIGGQSRIMSLERMRWYCDALETAADADGTFKIAEPTIHTDEEFARSQGLPGIISDGMITTNWISGLLARTYGLGYVARGSLRTKFIRPIFKDEEISTCARVTGYEQTPDGTVVSLDVWCEKADGQPCTVGSATALLGVEAQA